ncbi:unnamed protein product [Tuber aestivum]|uniref:Uncharacterized protein n=1 Tax=Tuber aestivum TaxID=59557 RepID=A0A292Q0P1_9PEZI|nr:unnamed protein product [Tuber aestivum]
MVVEVKPFTPSLAVYDVGGAHRLFDTGALLSLYLQNTPYPEVGPHGQHLFTFSVPIFQRAGRDEPSEWHGGIKEVREDGNLFMIPNVYQQPHAYDNQRGRPEEFMLSSAHAQVFLYPFGNWQHRTSRIEALICRDGVASGQLHSVPANYVLDLLTAACAGWEDLIECSRKFLSQMKHEILGESTVNDRQIIRRLARNAQQWERLRSLHRDHLQGLSGLETLSTEARWFAGSDDEGGVATYSNILEAVKSLEDIGGRIEHLVQETNSLIQTTSNLITIEGGYRSRDQGESIRRITWITFIFLPLLFVASLFGMNVDVLEDNPSWLYFVYLSIPMILAILLATAILKHSKRQVKWILDTYGLRKKAAEAPKPELLSVKIDRDDGCQSPNLIWAAKTGQEALVRLLLDTNVEIDAKQDGLTALHWATRYAHGRVADMIASRAKCVNTIDELGCTPLHWVARNGLADLAPVLLEKGADHNVLDNEGMSPLEWAILNGNLNIYTIISELDEDDGPVKTELHSAIGMGSLHEVLRLLSLGVSLEVKDDEGRTPLHLAIDLKSRPIVEALLQRGADIEAADLDGHTALHLAVMNGDVDLVRVLTSFMANVEAKGTRMRRPMHLAAQNGSESIVDALIQRGAMPHPADSEGNLPLHLAAGHGHHKVVKQLIDIAPSGSLSSVINTRNSFQHTPLHLAANQNIETVAELLKAGANVDTASGPENATPSMLAARSGKGDILEMLLHHMPAPTDALLSDLLRIGFEHSHAGVVSALQNRGVRIGQTALDSGTTWQTFKSGNLELSKIFLANGFDVNTIGPLGMTALHFAAGSGSLSMVHQLLNHGADISIADEWGWTPLHAASSAGHDKVVALLLMHGADKDAKDVYKWLPVHLAAASMHDAVVRVLTNGLMESRDVRDYPKEEKVVTAPPAPEVRESEGFVISELMSGM